MKGQRGMSEERQKVSGFALRLDVQLSSSPVPSVRASEQSHTENYELVFGQSCDISFLAILDGVR